MDRVRLESFLLGTCPGIFGGISKECVVCGIQQPGKKACFLCCDVLSDFSRSLLHTECFECLVVFLLAVAPHQLDTQCSCIIYHPDLDIPE